MGQFDQQLQSSSQPEDHLLSVLAERHVQKKLEPEGQNLSRRTTAAAACLRHGEGQEVLQEVTLEERKREGTCVSFSFGIEGWTWAILEI